MHAGLSFVFVWGDVHLKELVKGLWGLAGFALVALTLFWELASLSSKSFFISFNFWSFSRHFDSALSVRIFMVLNWFWEWESFSFVVSSSVLHLRSSLLLLCWFCKSRKLSFVVLSSASHWRRASVFCWSCDLYFIRFSLFFLVSLFRFWICLWDSFRDSFEVWSWFW